MKWNGNSNGEQTYWNRKFEYRAVLSNGSMIFVGNYKVGLQSWKQYCLCIMCEICMSFGSEGNGNFKSRSFWELVVVGIKKVESEHDI